MADDTELARIAYDIMADQAADRMRGPLPSYRRESSLKNYLERPLPQAQFDGQLGYDTTMAREPEPPPADTGERDFTDRVFSVLRRMGATGAANFLGRTLAAQPGPRFSNRQIVGTEVESPFRGEAGPSMPQTYERGVGFANSPTQQFSRQEFMDELIAGQNPAGMGVLGGPKGAQRLILAGRRPASLWEDLQAAKEAKAGGATNQDIWREYGWGQGLDQGWRFELPMNMTTKDVRHPNMNLTNVGLTLPVGHELLTAYPSLGKIPIIRSPEMRGGAAYGPGRRAIPASIRTPSDIERIELPQHLNDTTLDSFFHELQHTVQTREGWMRRPTGMYAQTEDLDPALIERLLDDPKFEELRSMARMLYGDQMAKHPGFLNYLRDAQEVEARNAAGRDMAPSLRKFAPVHTEDVPRSLQSLQSALPWSPGDISELGPRFALNVPKATDQFMEKYKNLMLELGRAKSMGADAGTIADLQLQLGKLEKDMTLTGRGIDPKTAPAFKDPGGVWHPQTRELLFRRIIEDTRAAEQKDVDWAKRAVDNYLNKYAGTTRDPLKDITIPYGEGTARWEDLWDKSGWRTEASKYTIATDPKVLQELVGANRPDEIVNAIHDPSIGGTSEGRKASKAILDYISHANDYMEQNVVERGADHFKYDLPRMLMETFKNDQAVAKKMEKAAKAAQGSLPVYKEYPDGFRWVQLKLPEKLTPDQAAGVASGMRTDVLEEIRKRKGGNWTPPESMKYIPLDSKGKPIVSGYTRDFVGGKTPEEAWLAGRLAEEGTQMGHCVGGYCDQVASGESGIYSLRDKEGRSHITIETTKRDNRGFEMLRQVQSNETDWRKYTEEMRRRGFVQDSTGIFKDPTGHRATGHDQVAAMEAIFPWTKGFMTKPEYGIRQIKGKQNRAPIEEYQPFAQDFVKSGTWESIMDLENTGLMDAKNMRYSAIPWAHGTAYEDVKLLELLAGGGVPGRSINLWDSIEPLLPKGERYVTKKVIEETLATAIKNAREKALPTIVEGYKRRGWTPPNITNSKGIIAALEDLNAARFMDEIERKGR